MRYREGQTPGELGPPVRDDMLVVEAAIALLVGVGLTIAGIRGRQIWLAFWGGDAGTGEHHLSWRNCFWIPMSIDSGDAGKRVLDFVVLNSFARLSLKEAMINS